MKSFCILASTIVSLLLPACSSFASDPDTTTPDSPVSLPPGPYVPGKSYLGRNSYVEYIAGNAPVILTAPHGGMLDPATIPDRTAASCGGSVTTVTDLNTAELAREVQQSYFARFGRYPHVIITHLSRRKLDSNRTGREAACGNPEASTAYAEWHGFIDVAKTSVLTSAGRGFYIDLHGHAHTVPRLELGYLLDASELNLSDAELDAAPAHEDRSSVRTISRAATASFSELIRGTSSLGTLYASDGFRAVPSAADPRPGSDEYFSGGDNTLRHGCSISAGPLGGTPGGSICGVQLEANFAGVRDTPANRRRFGDVTAAVLEVYLRTHWDIELRQSQ